MIILACRLTTSCVWPFCMELPESPFPSSLRSTTRHFTASWTWKTHIYELWHTQRHVKCTCASTVSILTSLRRMQCTMTMMNPSRESKTAKRIWNSAERRSVMANTADIHVSARRGRTTQELHSDALQYSAFNTTCSGLYNVTDV